MNKMRLVHLHVKLNIPDLSILNDECEKKLSILSMTNSMLIQWTISFDFYWQLVQRLFLYDQWLFAGMRNLASLATQARLHETIPRAIAEFLHLSLHGAASYSATQSKFIHSPRRSLGKWLCIYAVEIYSQLLKIIWKVATGLHSHDFFIFVVFCLFSTVIKKQQTVFQSPFFNSSSMFTYISYIPIFPSHKQVITHINQCSVILNISTQISVQKIKYKNTGSILNLAVVFDRSWGSIYLGKRFRDRKATMYYFRKVNPPPWFLLIPSQMHFTWHIII